MAGSEAEIASVLGHEATHVVKRHSAKQISDAQAKLLIAQLALGRSSGLVQTVAGLGLQIDQLHYSRSDEAEADKEGFKYLTEAGYKPEAMAAFFQKLQTKESGGRAGVAAKPSADQEPGRKSAGTNQGITKKNTRQV